MIDNKGENSYEPIIHFANMDILISKINVETSDTICTE